ncbi:hypothetical protein QL285_090004 [Trifolium repens]|nr:hypothetical protein QL285_090004 [Trifolium repens]
MVRKFNLALLGKWSWRLLVKQEGLWFKVLVAKYGVENGRVSGGGRNAFSWWKDVCDVREGVGLSVGCWSDVNLSRKVGNGEKIDFWRDKWLGDEPLNIKFSRLFELSVDKNISVADMYRRGWGVREAGWRWRRRVFLWEELDMECCAALDFIFLQDAIPDRWRWLPDPNTGYSVSGAYHLLTHIVSLVVAAHNNVIWTKIAPLKVPLFAWRLLNNRLPTKDKLICRGMTHLDSILCTSGCGVAETSNHLFLGCNFSHFLWCKILYWLGVCYLL